MQEHLKSIMEHLRLFHSAVDEIDSEINFEDMDRRMVELREKLNNMDQNENSRLIENFNALVEWYESVKKEK